jgi:hypothetical protein
MGELPLLWFEPGGRERSIREEKEAKDGHEARDCTFTAMFISTREVF